MKKKSTTKEEFEELLKREMMWRYWSKSEHELIIEISEDERILLRPWIGCRDVEYYEDVTDNEYFDWKGFAKYHINNQIYENRAKIDVYDQLQWRWDEFVTYCWNFHHKWQRRNKNEL